MVDERWASWIVEASPAPKRPLITAVERHAASLRPAVEGLRQSWTCTPSEFGSVWAPQVPNLGFIPPANRTEATRRAAQCLVATWLTAYAIDAVAPDSTVAEAFQWFAGSGGPELDLELPAVRPFDGHPPPRSTIYALLPYLLDFGQPGTRREILTGRADTGARKQRKAKGVYLTPGDVAQFMVEGVAQHRQISIGATWLDPAAGTGVFLRHVLARDPAGQVFGIDIEPTAGELATFVLLATTGTERSTPLEAWRQHRSRFATGDGLMCTRQHARSASEQSRLLGLPSELLPDSGSHDMLGVARTWHIGDAFPALAVGADVVILNPPYAATSPSRRIPTAQRFGAEWSDMYPLFLRVGLELAKDDGRLAAVVPASIVNSGVAAVMAARSAIADSRAEVEILTYDRAPDGLFGDDVKTRASIMFVDRARAPMLRLGPMLRITSRHRAEQLQRGSAAAQPLDELRSARPPKIASSSELQLLDAIRSAPATLADHLLAVRPAALRSVTDDERTVLIAPTAYNWLNIQASALPAVSAGHDATNPYLLLTASSMLARDAAYASLNSRLSFWCWRVVGDGFHVNRSLLGYVPMPLPDHESEIRRLAKLGRELWELAQTKPVVSVNGGRTSVAFPPGAAPGTFELVAEIDGLLIEYLKLSDLAVNLVQWMRDLASVGRPEERTGAVAWSVTG